jgi:flavin reductase (DIM6/NTAB) family NADH-FMN oxidoreductase RutF
LSVPVADYIAGMRRLASGVTIVTTSANGIRAGLTVTSVCSLTATPPRLLACIHREADAHGLILASGRFAVNLLKPEHQGLSDHFGGCDDSYGPCRFTIGGWTEGVTGAPFLPDAAAVFECRLVEQVAASTHTILIGEVVALRQDPDAAALVYLDRTYHRLPVSAR